MAARRDERKEEKLRKILLSAQREAAGRVRGLFRKPSEPDYNPDAALTWKECSVATRAALELAKASLAAERARTQAQAQPVLGVVMMAPRIEDPSKWEALASQVRATGAIDVEATPVPALPARESKE